MVRRVESQVSFFPEPESEFTLADADGAVLESMEVLIYQTKANYDDIKWESGMGNAGYVGLSERLTEKFRQVTPVCDPNRCVMHTEIQAHTGVAEETKLTLTCDIGGESSQEAAEAEEAHCVAHHRKTFEDFVKYVTSTASEIIAAQDKLNDAHTVVTEETSHIKRLV